MKNKRGSHVGVILSFVIFVTFLVFLYSVLEPSIRIREDKENLLDNLKIELKEKFLEEIEIITFVIDTTTSSNCVRLENLASQLANPNFVINNESGEILSDFRSNGGDVLINRLSTDNNFFRIYNSVEFGFVNNQSISNCEIVPENSYVFKSASTEEEIFLSLINQTKLEYEINYTSLKDELNIPVAGNFGFSFTDKKTVLIETQTENVSTSVYAEEIPVLYVDSEANINSGFLTIKVW